MQNINVKLIPIPFPGYPAPIWFRYIDRISKIIEKNGLKPISTEHVPRLSVTGMDVELGKLSPAVSADFIIPRWGDHGGIRGPHLHFNGKTYMVDAKVWSEFTKPIVADLRAGLENVGSVSVEQAVQMDELTSELMGH